MNKVGLVLSGGGARGFAHVGIVKVLDELKVKPICVSGCSMGAIIGALYCLGYSGKEIEKKIKALSIKDILGTSFGKKSNGSRIQNYFNEIFEKKNFEDLKIPLYVNAVDIVTGEEVIFDKGNLAKAVRASIAIPGMFKPVIMGDRILVDGGVKNNIPLQVLLDQKLDKIITVSVGPNKVAGSILETVHESGEGKKVPRLSSILIKSLLIMQSNEHMINFSRRNSDLFIVPPLEKYLLMDFKKSKKIIKIGDTGAEKYKKEIKCIFKKGKVKNFLKRGFN